jgi:hypothetical protein
MLLLLTFSFFLFFFLVAVCSYGKVTGFGTFFDHRKQNCARQRDETTRLLQATGSGTRCAVINTIAQVCATRLFVFALVAATIRVLV